VPKRQEITGLLVQLLGLAATFAGLVRQMRSDNWRPRHAAVHGPHLAAAPGAAQQLRGRRPVDPARLRLLRDPASTLANPRGQVLMVVGLGLTTVGQTVVHPHLAWFAFIGLYAVLLVTSSVSVLRRQAQARRFLATYA